MKFLNEWNVFQWMKCFSMNEMCLNEWVSVKIFKWKLSTAIHKMKLNGRYQSKNQYFLAQKVVNKMKVFFSSRNLVPSSHTHFLDWKFLIFFINEIYENLPKWFSIFKQIWLHLCRRQTNNWDFFSIIFDTIVGKTCLECDWLVVLKTHPILFMLQLNS